MNPLFIGSKLKVKRADQHIDELKSIILAFLKTDFYRLHIEKDPKNGNNVLKFETTKEMPCEVPLIIGDAIHNLRAALDLMACEIVVMAGDTPDRWTKFPFRDTREELVGAIKGGKIKAAPQTIIDLIVDTIKPYKGGNDPLCDLDDLDIVDKHKLLIPTTSVVGLTGVSAEDEGHNSFEFQYIAVGQGKKQNIVSTPYNLNITKQGQPAFDVRFDKGQIFEGQPVIPTLHKLSQLVSGIVQTIEKAYFALGKETT
jgi:hypothetical protein